jgi:hypothetical protein
MHIYISVPNPSCNPIRVNFSESHPLFILDHTSLLRVLDHRIWSTATLNLHTTTVRNPGQHVSDRRCQFHHRHPPQSSPIPCFLHQTTLCTIGVTLASIPHWERHLCGVARSYGGPPSVDAMESWTSSNANRQPKQVHAEESAHKSQAQGQGLVVFCTSQPSLVHMHAFKRFIQVGQRCHQVQGGKSQQLANARKTKERAQLPMITMVHVRVW